MSSDFCVPLGNGKGKEAMRSTALLTAIAILGMCLSAVALTGSGDSATRPLETVAPVFSALAANPPQAEVDDTVSITFTASELLGAPPDVTVNGSAADFAGETKAGNYTYTYTVREADGLGAAVVEISGADLVGNPGSLSSSSVLEIVEAPPVPVYAWPVFLVLLAAGLSAFALRRRNGTALLALLLLAAPVAMAQAPTVSSVAFVQQDNGAGGTEVIITYDLDSPNGPSEIAVALSKDGGMDGFPFAVTSVTGDLSGVTTDAGHMIVWDIAADYPGEDILNAQIRVYAFDYVPEMIPVSACTFQMGNSGVGEDAPFSTGLGEDPQHTVNLSAYEIGKFEVTNQQTANVYNWANGQGYFTTVDAATATAFGQELLDLDSSGCHVAYSGGVFTPETRTGLPGTTTYSMAEHPVQEISWYGAVAYCNWLSEIAGLTPVYNTGTWTANFANDGYHLPTEAQWERAAAWDGAKHWIYSFLSDTLTGNDRCNYLLATAVYVNPLGLTGNSYTSPVGWFDGNNTSPNGLVPTVDSPSPVGCYDMTGNVSEWCHDWYDSGYYGSSPGTDPEGPASGSARVLRGGSYNYFNFICRSAFRDCNLPDSTNDYYGFRVSRTP